MLQSFLNTLNDFKVVADVWGNRPKLNWSLSGKALINTCENLDMLNISITATVDSQEEVPLVLNEKKVSKVVGEKLLGVTIHWNGVSKGFSSVSFGNSGKIRLVTTEEIANKVFHEYLPY